VSFPTLGQPCYHQTVLGLCPWCTELVKTLTLTGEDLHKPSARPAEVMPDVKSKPWLDGKLTTDEQVYRTMLRDFPPEAVEWVRHAAWRGPVDVPLGDVDFSHERSWAAWRETGKVKLFRNKLKQKLLKNRRLKPAILVKTPRNNQLIIIDGHHRAMASRQLGVPLYAFIGLVHKERGPWLQTHARQLTEAEGGSVYSYADSKDR
jgi:ParB/Sulfiredoxin domain